MEPIFKKLHSKVLLKKTSITYVFGIPFLIFSKQPYSGIFLSGLILKIEMTFCFEKDVQHYSIYPHICCNVTEIVLQ